MAYRSPVDVDLVSSAQGLFFWLAEVTNFWFYRMLMISIGVIVFFGYLRSSNDEDFFGAFAVSTYITWGLGTLLAVIGLVPGVDWGIMTGLLVVATILLLIFKD